MSTPALSVDLAPSFAARKFHPFQCQPLIFFTAIFVELDALSTSLSSTLFCGKFLHVLYTVFLGAVRDHRGSCCVCAVAP